MFKYLFISSFLAAPNLVSTVISTCTVNGRLVDCSAMSGFFGIFGAVFAGIWLLWLVLIILLFAANWKIYVKAGKPGWASLVPIYNIIVYLDIVGKPFWWIILMFIPFVNFVVAIILAHRLSLSFGKSIGFTFGLIFLSPIFIPILGFGKAVYQKLGDSVVQSTPTLTV
jgi:hypothetical protein